MELQELPELGTHALGIEKVPVDHYISNDFFEFEKREVFGKSWLMVGRESDLAAPGEFIKFEIGSMDLSVVVVRNKDKQLRAFHNACTHRGAPLVSKPCGRARGGLVCPFHGWAFDFNGKLIDVPAVETFAQLDMEGEHLKPVSVEIWGGFVWINLDPKPEIPLTKFLEPMGPEYDRYLGKSAWSWSYGWRASVKGNWKLLIDAQIEGYHTDHLHRTTIAGNVPSESCRASINHGSIGVPSKFNVYRPEVMGVQTPITLAAAQYGANSLYTESSKVVTDEGGEGVLGTHPRWIFDSIHIMPNIVMFLQRGQIFVQRTYPVSADESVWEVDFYHDEPSRSFGDVFNAEQSRIQIRDVLSEDISMSEALQRTYRSGVIQSVNLSRQEVPLRAFYQALKRIEENAELEGAAA